MAGLKEKKQGQGRPAGSKNKTTEATIDWNRPKTQRRMLMALSQPQQLIANSTARFRVCTAGRRFGKTHLSIRELAKFARHPNRTVLYVAPTYRQAKQIVWESLKLKLDRVNWIKTVNESELTITLVNGTKIMLRSADAGESIRGIGADFVVLDEVQDIHPDIWWQVIRPALADREGHGLLIGTPKGTGNILYDLFTQAKQLDDWESWQFTTAQGGMVSESEINSARASMDSRTFRQEFEATFETYAGAVYYNFDPQLNVMDLDHTVNNRHVMMIGSDQNVDPMTAVISQVINNTVYVYDEVVIYGSNTQELCDEIRNRYNNKKIHIHPDASGSARKTSSNTTDHNIMRNAGFVLKVNRSQPAVRDRINSVNSMLLNTNGERRLVVHPRCKRLIEALIKHQYKEGTQVPDKNSGYDHITDALGYLVEFNFPVRASVSIPEQPRTFRLR